jgi:hypothetical protein
MSAHVLEENRADEIARLGLSPAVEAFLRELSAPEALRYLFNPPGYFYSQGSPERPANWPGLENLRLLPLWEHFEQVFVADLSVTPVRYFSFYIESPSDVREFGASIYSMLFFMLDRHVWEYGGDTIEAADALSLAESLGFPRLDALQSLLSRPVDATDEQIEEYKSLLVS